MKLEEAIEHAAGHLPERMVVSLNIEAGSAWIELFDIAEGTPINLEEAGVCMDLPLADQLSSAVEIARAWK